jgi:hypothetical protein
MKQTAVEWLVEKLSYSTSDGTIISHHKIITNLVEQAKEMEKEQMKNACIQHSYENKSFQKLLEKQFEQYYNETFKSE